MLCTYRSGKGPEVLAIWGPMEALLEGMELAEVEPVHPRRRR